MSVVGRRSVLIMFVLGVLLVIGFHYADRMTDAGAMPGREVSSTVIRRRIILPMVSAASEERGTPEPQEGRPERKILFHEPVDFVSELITSLEDRVRSSFREQEAGGRTDQGNFCRTMALEMTKSEAESLLAKGDDVLKKIPSIAGFPKASPLFRSMQLFALLFPAVENITTTASAGAAASPPSFSCGSVLMDHLFEWAFHSIGNEFRNLQPKNEGIFYLSHRRMSRSRGIGGHWRFGWFPQALAERVAAAKHNNFTMMYLSIHDADLWTIASESHGGKERITEALEKFPNAFLIHPSGRTDKDGHLYRTVPIPHAPSEIVFIDFPAIRVPYEQRTVKKVAWRGSTTGEYQKPYSHTDRYRMVKAFQQLNANGSADVAFSGIAQGNNPDFPLGASLDRRQIMHHKATLDVDGNSNSWEGLRWKLLAGAAVVKVRSGLGFVQWYYHRMRSGEELIETDVEHVVSEAMRVVDNATLGTHLAEKALAFGEKYLTPAAVDEAVWDLIGNVWRYGYDFGKDWRIRHQ